jgi:DNA-binding GntR family transcriptional regulator
MNDQTPDGHVLLADQAYEKLIAALRTGRVVSGQFVSMPALVDLIGLPLAATREAVKRAEARGLVSILPKRGVVVMDAGPETTRDCMDLRALLDTEGARRLIARSPDLALDDLRTRHRDVLEAARRALTPDLPKRALATDLSLHDLLASGLGNPLAAEAYRTNRDRIAVIQHTRPFLPDRIVSAMEEHLGIIDALERRDEAAAVAAIRAHYHTTLRWWGILLDP